MRTEIRELHQRLKTTTIYVTHDQIEAMTMADKIVVLQNGVIEQIGSPWTFTIILQINSWQALLDPRDEFLYWDVEVHENKLVARLNSGTLPLNETKHFLLARK